MADKGMTIKQGFTRALEDYRKLGDTEMVEFFEKRLEQVNKKSDAPKKRTPRQIENDAYKEIILNGMTADTEYTIDDMLMYFGLPLEMKNQRVSALLSQLVEEHKVERVADSKGHRKFKLAA